MSKAKKTPRAVVLAIALFASGIFINYAIVVFGDLPSLKPGLGDTAIHAFLAFVVAHLTIIPFFTFPFWLPQSLSLCAVFLGKSWARYLLILFIVPVWYFFLSPLEFQAAFHSKSYDHVERELVLCVRAVGAVAQFVALIILWTADSSRIYFNSAHKESPAGVNYPRL